LLQHQDMDAFLSSFWNPHGRGSGGAASKIDVKSLLPLDVAVDASLPPLTEEKDEDDSATTSSGGTLATAGSGTASRTIRMLVRMQAVACSDVGAVEAKEDPAQRPAAVVGGVDLDGGGLLGGGDDCSRGRSSAATAAAAQDVYTAVCGVGSCVEVAKRGGHATVFLCGYGVDAAASARSCVLRGIRMYTRARHDVRVSWCALQCTEPWQDARDAGLA
jgi:hypothetical protein